MRVVGIMLWALVACGAEPQAPSAGEPTAAPSDGREAVVATPAAAPPARGTAEELPAELRARMIGVSWREGCPVPLDDLALLRVPYRDPDGERRVGELVVAQAEAEAVLAAFAGLYEAGFPVARMETIEAFGGDDDASMAANNTSGFNCRTTPGGGQLSKHAYGRAIDVNPLVNPYVKGDVVLPPEGRAWLDRTRETPGMIREGDAAVTAFREAGWQWGGRWRSLKDYQHFEAP